MWPEALGITTALLGGGTGIGLALHKGLRSLVLPPPPEQFLTDLLPFLKLEEDQKTITCKDGTFFQVLKLKGLCYGPLKKADIQAAEFKRHTWFKSLAEYDVQVRIFSRKSAIEGQSGLSGKEGTLCRRGSLQEDSCKESSYEGNLFESPVLGKIHDLWQQGVSDLFETNHYCVLSLSKKSDLKKLAQLVKGTEDILMEYSPSALEGATLLSFLSSFLNATPVDCFTSSRFADSPLTDRRFLAARHPTSHPTDDPTANDLVDATGRSSPTYRPPLVLSSRPLSEFLSFETVTFDSHLGTITYGDSKVFEKVLSLSQWGEMCQAEIIGDLLRIPGEITLFHGLQRKCEKPPLAKEFLEQRKGLKK